MKDVALILLASGLSTRFGSDKLMADLNGMPVMIHAAKVAAAIRFGARYAVTGAETRRAVTLAYAGFTVLNNPEPSAGQGSSIAVGASRALADGFDSALIMLADMPLVDTEHLEALMSLRNQGDVIMSESGGVKMPPAVFSGKALSQLTHGAGATTAMKSRALTVPISASAALDIDTPADLIKVAAIMERDRRNG